MTFEKMNKKEILICTKLHSAIEERNLEKTMFLLKSGADVNSKNKLNLAPIHFAVWTGDLRFLKILVEHGADLDAQDLQGFTALHLAVLNNDLKAADYLISNGASISINDYKGFSPILHSFVRNSVEMFKFLVTHANQETKDKECILIMGGNSLLHYAVTRIASEYVQILINAGASLHLKNDHGNNPIETALSYNVTFLKDIGMFKMISFLK